MTVRLLIELGADPLRPNLTGLTPVRAARSNKACQEILSKEAYKRLATLALCFEEQATNAEAPVGTLTDYNIVNRILSLVPTRETVANEDNYGWKQPHERLKQYIGEGALIEVPSGDDTDSSEEDEEERL